MHLTWTTRSESEGAVWHAKLNAEDLLEVEEVSTLEELFSWEGGMGYAYRLVRDRAGEFHAQVLHTIAFGKEWKNIEKHEIHLMRGWLAALVGKVGTDLIVKTLAEMMLKAEHETLHEMSKAMRDLHERIGVDY